MTQQDTDNRPSGMEPAEGSRETAESNLEQGAESGRGQPDPGGITNRLLDEEIENQAELPPRGEVKNPETDHA